jgi:sigma54-dependent transcription regulator
MAVFSSVGDGGAVGLLSIERGVRAAHISSDYVDRGGPGGRRVIVTAMAGKWPFVGRRDELAQAEKILASEAGVLFLGPAGIGKTALARRLADRAAARGTALIHVAGRAVSSGTPFEAFADAATAGEMAGDTRGAARGGRGRGAGRA